MTASSLIHLRVFLAIFCAKFRSMKIFQIFLTFIGSIGLLTSFGVAQSAKTILWSPPDKSFTIEVPATLKKFDGYGEADDPNAVQNYAAKNSANAFVVYILTYKEYRTKTTDDKFGGLFFMIGGDDDHEFTEKNTTIDGLPAREIIYKNQDNKGLFIDAGDFVIVLGMAAKKRKELDSIVANQFFNSFRLKRHANTNTQNPND